MKQANRILIADDSPDVRADLRMLLDLLDEVEVVGEAARAGDVLQAAYAVEPDVVIIDLEMGESTLAEMDGLAAIRELKRTRPSTTVFVLTVHGYPAARQAALRAGADAFFIKGQDTDKLLSAVRAARAPKTDDPCRRR